ncbi:Putative ubiquitin-conjugating enzyme E2, UBA-like superfamily, ubiquitin-conjugating enzyme/RWD [Septoria linicola]|uniref:Ubiquitin-conjugating enzyme E2 1 n=1 Tax=Septoria linicola TaxID=215465 RepID=A0A9Q9EJM8_9PEZI|nr:putative ubiquitin-conjugating enzyme E2, UBA-like superfamily, ubiquitin-conjugating enzyme/RWD [Septoria linicola]USW51513.1 Putative ubiquitin-conjugating enzyme E2, UBA-like superfamily, ubiquitin-conjugating enzyme/RWD [Septoria linicola]
MTANRNRRLQKEIADIIKDSHSGIRITGPSGSSDITDFTHFKGHFTGPPDTPYEGGKYEIDIQITGEYPFKPPVMKFITKIWHPNVSSQTGAICLDTLGSAWSPVLTLKSALISLQSLLSSPEPSDPQDAEVAGMLLTRPDEFKHVAKQWAMDYASAPQPRPGTGKGGASSSHDEKEQKKPSDKEDKRRREAARVASYRGYHDRLVNQFTDMGFSAEDVVAAFEWVGIDKNDGEYYQLEEEYMGDITARLFGETE